MPPRLTEKQEVMIYLINRLNKLGDKLNSRKKLMKLMFLLEHYDLELGRLIKNKLVGNRFIVYRYGVFSDDVMDDYINLYERRLLNEHPIEITRSISLRLLDEKTITRIDNIISRFGNYKAWDLEDMTLNMLGLTKKTKVNFFDVDVRKFIKPKYELPYEVPIA